MAEHHHQYSVLVEFATDPVVGGNDKVYKYIAQYGEPFSSTLYAHYANRGKSMPCRFVVAVHFAYWFLQWFSRGFFQPS
jgi:hypothetical protein